MKGAIVVPALAGLAAIVLITQAAVFVLPAETSPTPGPTPAPKLSSPGRLASPPLVSATIVPASRSPELPTPRAPEQLPHVTPTPPPVIPPEPLTLTLCNNADNSGGLGLLCAVVVVNTITVQGGTATVTVRECHGAAGDPEAACSSETTVLAGRVATIQLCNGSINGGGGTLRCTVQVTTNFVGLEPRTVPATVRQCVGSGDGITLGCVPFPATAAGAAISQCNGSANGGTLVGMSCTAGGAGSAVHAVMIVACNGSGNGGGALVVCSAALATRPWE